MHQVSNPASTDFTRSAIEPPHMHQVSVPADQASMYVCIRSAIEPPHMHQVSYWASMYAPGQHSNGSSLHVCIRSEIQWSTYASGQRSNRSSLHVCIRSVIQRIKHHHICIRSAIQWSSLHSLPATLKGVRHIKSLAHVREVTWNYVSGGQIQLTDSQVYTA